MLYPGTPIVGAPYYARSWQSQDNTYTPTQYTEDHEGGPEVVDPPANKCALVLQR